VNLILFVVVGLLRMASLAIVGNNYDSFGIVDSYVDLDYVIYFAKQVENVNSFNAVLSFMKLFKFAQENKKMSQLINTLEIAAVDMVSIMAIIAVIATGYGIAFHIAFGHAVTEYVRVEQASAARAKRARAKRVRRRARAKEGSSEGGLERRRARAKEGSGEGGHERRRARAKEVIFCGRSGQARRLEGPRAKRVRRRFSSAAEGGVSEASATKECPSAAEVARGLEGA
jgi:hypothetical protein